MSSIPSELRSRIEQWGQGHVFKYVDDETLRSKYSVSDSDVSDFINQLETIDYERIRLLLSQAKEDVEGGDFVSFSPPKEDDIYTLSSRSVSQSNEWWRIGLDSILNGQIAVCILAGGQGTRMGLAPDESKGMLKMGGLESGKFVFQLFFERMLKLKELAGASKHIPILIMTSPINNEKVRSFLKSHGYFGYPQEDVLVFKQGTLPALTLNGDLLLESHCRLAISPDGNGGVYNALVSEGVMDELNKRGVVGLHVMSVDNAIARPADPIFMGACIKSGCEIGNKVVWKSDWKEKVGVIALKNGKTSVVEYSDLYNPDLGIDNPLIRARTADGTRLVFGAGNICNHYYSIAGLHRILPQVTANYHLAVKKIACVNETTGEIEKPKVNNGLKLESFIFDAFELANSSIIVEADRVSEFSPMKNATGDDSPDTAVDQIWKTHASWLCNAGAFIDEAVHVEILPEVSYSGEGLEALKGMHFHENTLITNEWMKKNL
jgi:UDP-N-acetylglucosamine/UDP-N-acetylgalactosamine diphosphorylase